MAKVELIMPKMGESVAEATVIKWLKNVGETIEMDESVLEIATDKVDSEVPSAVEGVLVEQLFTEDDVVKVGQAVAIIETDSSTAIASVDEVDVEAPKEAIIASEIVEKAMETTTLPKAADSNKFFSPLVRSIAQQEGMSMSELESVSGTGKDHRVTKKDILNYLKNRSSAKAHIPQQINTPSANQSTTVQISSPTIPAMEGDEIIEMDRMRKMIANHMVMSKHVSPHVTSFVEADVTNIVTWSTHVKDAFFAKEGEKITFTPVFIEAVVKAIKDFPMINVAVDGTNIIKRKHINVGMAAALPSGNLIVPVIKDADQKNMIGLTKTVKD